MGEWGELVRTWSAAQPGSGYVRYKWRSSAQFALEAMHGRPLSPEDATPCELSWALHDPEMEMAQAGSALALRSMQEAKRRREAQQRMYEQLELEARRAKYARAEPTHSAPSLSRPSATSAAHVVTDDAQTGSYLGAAAIPLTAVTAVYPSADAEVLMGADALHETGEGGRSADDDTLPDGWEIGCDSCSGHIYFYCTATGRSQWERPT
uniref:WW domain-containing protein n=2 Tax=Chrysotila carterae TaxID=13221 RepID=A0A7S4BQK7_CHRCT|mmetsp:Transcript_8738/g.19042  ORF Transcript_8738/g.19042 Transcript_8738/m.19042 type:complete len:209 (+) Transcript_8738:847-1473(+)